MDDPVPAAAPAAGTQSAKKQETGCASAHLGSFYYQKIDVVRSCLLLLLLLLLPSFDWTISGQNFIHSVDGLGGIVRLCDVFQPPNSHVIADSSK